MIKANAQSPTIRLKPRVKNVKKNIALTCMALPGAIWLLLLRYLPMFGIVMSFQDFRMLNPMWGNIIQNIFKKRFIGLKNFEILFKSGDAEMIFRNTILYNVAFILLGLVIAVTFAIMLSEMTNRLLAKTYQTAMFFPYFLSWVVVSYFLWGFIAPGRGIFDSKELLGVNSFYDDPTIWPYMLVFFNIWKLTGYSTILYLSTIKGIDTTQYEAASIDGATKWQQVLHITLPHLRTIILVLFIMNVGKIFNTDFGLFYILPRESGTITNVIETVDTYVYRLFRNPSSMNLGMSTAVSLFQNFVGFICIVVANGIVRKVDKDSAMF